jgi:hypothetical protein
MKKAFIGIILLSLSSLVLADDSALSSVTITGEVADQIASLPSFSGGSSASSIFTGGNVKVICKLPIHLEQDDQSPPSHYVCVLNRSVQITGEDADKIAELAFLFPASAGASVSVSGNAKVSCRMPISLNEDDQSVSKHYSCKLSAAH